MAVMRSAYLVPIIGIKIVILHQLRRRAIAPNTRDWPTNKEYSRVTLAVGIVCNHRKLPTL